MDKNTNSYPHIPPSVVPNSQVQRPQSEADRLVADTSGVRSFETALDRRRDSLAARQQAMQKKALVESSERDSSDESDAHANFGGIDVSLLPDFQYLTQIIRNDVEICGSDSLSTSGSPVGSSASAPELHLHDASNAGVECVQSAAHGIGHSDAQTLTQSGIAATTLHGALTAESMSSMMLRLERMATTHDGQWRFAILDNPMGVTAMQMQRSAQGIWRVGISLNETAELDELAQAEELKAALLSQGHNVDSVTISRLSSNSERFGQ